MPRARVLAGALVLAVVLSGCAVDGGTGAEASASPSPAGTASSASEAPTPTPSPSAQPTAFDTDADIEQNLSVFAGVIDAVWAGDTRGRGRAYVDALSAAGFDKSAMELTPDASTVGNAAESIQISVLWDGECLIGQVGPAIGEPVAVVLPALAEGRCLVGVTRTIDW